MILSAAGMMSASCVSNILISADRLLHLHKIPSIVTILCIYVFILIVLYIIIEPEKLKFMAYVTTFILMIMAYSCFFDNIILAWANRKRFHMINYVFFPKTGEYTGVIAYAFEAAGSYMSRKFYLIY
jgi:uncharacterized membrane protein YccC